MNCMVFECQMNANGVFSCVHVCSIVCYMLGHCRLDRPTVDAELDEVVCAMIANYFEPEKNGLIPRKE